VSVQRTFNKSFKELNTETTEPGRLRLEKRGLCSTPLYVPLPAYAAVSRHGHAKQSGDDLQHPETGCTDNGSLKLRRNILANP
jgi:hypothetical protein